MGDADRSAPHPVSQFHYESVNDSVGPGITEQIGEPLCGVVGEGGISGDRGGMKCPRDDNKNDFIEVSPG